jgi:pimeloyl-ACP methyl ester carboxylesterase
MAPELNGAPAVNRNRSLSAMTTRLLVFICFIVAMPPALAYDLDYERETRWAEQVLPSILVGDPLWIEQPNGHKFLAIYTEAENPRGAIIVGHGRGWNPDFELYGMLRMKLSDEGYNTLAIQLPVLGPGAKVGDYIPTYSDASERYDLSAKFLQDRGFEDIAIVSHSLGATMANEYLIAVDETAVKAWVFISIINGLQEMFRIKIPVMDVYGSEDWVITQVGGYERKQQIMKVPGSRQAVLKDAPHFFEGKEDELIQVIVDFLDSVFHAEGQTSAISAGQVPVER